MWSAGKENKKVLRLFIYKEENKRNFKTLFPFKIYFFVRGFPKTYIALLHEFGNSDPGYKLMSSTELENFQMPFVKFEVQPV